MFGSKKSKLIYCKVFELKDDGFRIFFLNLFFIFFFFKKLNSSYERLLKSFDFFDPKHMLSCKESTYSNYT